VRRDARVAENGARADLAAEKRNCGVCKRSSPILDGVLCDAKQFICDPCIETHARSAIRSNTVKSEGIDCPVHRCACDRSPIPLKRLTALDERTDRQLRLACAQMATAPAPAYWTGKDGVIDDSGRSSAMERLMNQGMDPAQTGRGRDSHNQQFRKFRVVSVHRIQNKKLWKRYAANRATLVEDVHAARAPRTAVRTAAIVDQVLHPMVTANEVLLFHGTGSKSVADQICKNGFDPPTANSGAFGSGFYFAEDAIKSDQYTGGGGTGGVHYIFVARVALGRAGPPQGSGMCRRPSDGFDSAVAERPGLRFREFIVYNQDRAYPEFMLTYKRV
jgi:hypothetical protein